MKKYTVRPILTDIDVAELLEVYDFAQRNGDYPMTKTFLKIFHCNNQITEMKMKDGHENE